MLDYLTWHADLLVFALAALLYVIDSGHLITTRELLFVGTPRGNWRVVTPEQGFLFNRRKAVFPRLLDPGSIELRFRWPAVKGDPVAIGEDVARISAHLRLPRHVCRLLFVEVFLGLPAAYYLAASHGPLAVLLTAIYLQIVVLVIWLMVSRRALGLSIGTAALLAFEALVCIPYAPGLHRKVFHRAWPGEHSDPLSAANVLLSPAAKAQLLDHLRRATIEQSADSTAIVEWRSRLDGVT